MFGPISLTEDGKEDGIFSRRKQKMTVEIVLCCAICGRTVF